MELFDRVVFSVHCHNDLGLAVANSLAAIAAGAAQVHCTVNGIGERAGNASLEEVAAALSVHADQFGVQLGIQLNQTYPDQPPGKASHRDQSGTAQAGGRRECFFP